MSSTETQVDDMQEGHNQAGQREAVPTKAGWRPNEWAASTGLSRSKTYQLVKAGRIQAVRASRVTIITTSPAEYLASLRGEAA
jgi:hypothetical protein